MKLLARKQMRRRSAAIRIHQLRRNKPHVTLKAKNVGEAVSA